MAAINLHTVFNIISVIGFILVAVGFGTGTWFFSETDRWQFKCDLRTCCVRDIDPTPQLWTCWPIKDQPKLFRFGTALTSCGLALWLPTAVCVLAARVKVYPRSAVRLALCFLMFAGGLGAIGCRIMFKTAEESFIIAEIPGMSGQMVLWGFCLTLAGSVLASLAFILYLLDRALNLMGSLLGCVAALLFVLTRAALIRPLKVVFPYLLPVYVRLGPTLTRIFAALKRIFAASLRFLLFSEMKLISIAVRLKHGLCRALRILTPCTAPVIHLLRPRFLPVFASAVLILTAVLTFVQTKLVAISTFTLTKIATLLIVCSPRLYALLESLRPVLHDRTMLYKVTHQFSLRQRDAFIIYFLGLVQPSFQFTLKFIYKKTSKSRKINLTKAAVALNGVTIH